MRREDWKKVDQIGADWVLVEEKIFQKVRAELGDANIPLRLMQSQEKTLGLEDFEWGRMSSIMDSERRSVSIDCGHGNFQRNHWLVSGLPKPWRWLQKQQLYSKLEPDHIRNISTPIEQLIIWVSRKRLFVMPTVVAAVVKFSLPPMVELKFQLRRVNLPKCLINPLIRVPETERVATQLE